MRDSDITCFPVTGSVWWVDWFNVARGTKRHRAQDIFGRDYSKIIAVADGLVTQSTATPRGGLVITIRHASPTGPWESYYAHLSSRLVALGQQVLAGDLIGLQGNTGNAVNTRQHLHIALKDVSGGGRRPYNAHPRFMALTHAIPGTARRQAISTAGYYNSSSPNSSDVALYRLQQQRSQGHA